MAGKRAIAPEIHEIKGTYKAHPERKPATNAMADGGIPAKPADVESSENASRKWDQLIALLSPKGIIGSTIVELLTRYCLTYHVERVAWSVAEASGWTDKTAAIRWETASKELSRMLPEFGLTPASRGKIFGQIKPEQSPGEAAAAAIQLARTG